MIPRCLSCFLDHCLLLLVALGAGLTYVGSAWLFQLLCGSAWLWVQPLSVAQ